MRSLRLIRNLAWLLPLCGCMTPQDGQKTVLACWRGDNAACRDQGSSQQAALDASAILIGMRISATVPRTPQR